MKAGREDVAAVEEAAVEAEEKPAAVVAATVGMAEGAVAAMGGGAPSALTAPAAVAAVEPAVGEQVEEEMAVDLEQQRAKRKRELYELVDEVYAEAELASREIANEAEEFEEEVSDELSEEDSEDVDHDKDSKDNKSRYVLRKLRNGEILYRTEKRYVNICCPFCCKGIAQDFKSMIQHATGVGKGSQTHLSIVKARHAAFGAFLRKYVQGHEPFFFPPPPRPAKKAKN